MSNKVEEPLAEYGQPLTFEKVWRMFQETDKKFQETDRQMKETAERMKETDERMKETDKRMKELQSLFTSQWGKLMEALVKGDLIPILNSWGIPIQDLQQRRAGNYKGTSYEFDIIAQNGKEVVIVEVKTTLKPDHVKDFLHKLDHVKEWIKAYSDNTIYGAVAYLTEEGASERMAEKRGLFVIRATGNSASIVNNENFEPKAF